MSSVLGGVLAPDIKRCALRVNGSYEVVDVPQVACLPQESSVTRKLTLIVSTFPLSRAHAEFQSDHKPAIHLLVTWIRVLGVLCEGDSRGYSASYDNISAHAHRRGSPRHPHPVRRHEVFCGGHGTFSRFPDRRRSGLTRYSSSFAMVWGSAVNCLRAKTPS